jgi:hypothetical protein
MRKLIVTAIVAFVTAQANAAPASPDSVETLLTVMKTEAMLDAMYTSMEEIMRQSMRQAIGGKPVTPEQQRILDAVPGKFVAVMKSEFTWDKLKSQFVQLYVETFDQEEIDGLLAFYRSAPGQAFIKKMPSVMQKSMVIAQSQMQTLLPKMKAAIEQAVSDAKLAK